VEVELPGSKILICNVDNLYFVELHNWRCSSYGYTVTTIDKTKHYFHNVVMWHHPGTITVDHCNQNRLDCWKANLRLVDKTTQSINWRLQVNNKTGITGLSYDMKRRGWVAKWNEADCGQCSKFFSKNKYGDSKACFMAIEHRLRMISPLPHYVEALQLDN